MNRRTARLIDASVVRRVRQITVAGLTTTLLLTGCTAILPEKNQQTPEQTHEAVQETLESTIELLGGPEGWSEYENRSADECEVGGLEGVAYKEIQSGPGVASIAERDEVVEQVREHLESLGMTVWLAEKTAADPMVRVLAEGGPTEGFSVYVDTEQISIQGESWCVPGDWQELLHQEQDHTDE